MARSQTVLAITIMICKMAPKSKLLVRGSPVVKETKIFHRSSFDASVMCTMKKKMILMGFFSRTVPWVKVLQLEVLRTHAYPHDVQQ